MIWTFFYIFRPSLFRKPYKTLIEGEHVEFDLKQDDNGKNIAVDITGPYRGPLLCENTERRVYAVRRTPPGTGEGDNLFQSTSAQNKRTNRPSKTTSGIPPATTTTTTTTTTEE